MKMRAVTPIGHIKMRLPRCLLFYSSHTVVRGLLSGVRVQGDSPCTEDTVAKEDFGLLGTPEDMQARVALARHYTPSLAKNIQKARDFIYKKGYAIKYRGVEELLKAQSWSATRVRRFARMIWIKVFTNMFQSAFERLVPLGLDVFKMLVPDVLHEFELGIWKMILAHLVRLLYASGGDSAVNELDNR
jgi:hypothetical protein